MRKFWKLNYLLFRPRWGHLTIHTSPTATLPQNINSCQSIIEEYIRESRPYDAEVILKEMIRYEMKPDVILYTSIINSYAEADLCDDAVRIHQDMINSGLQPNVVSYTTVMKAYGRVTKPYESEKLFNEMTLRGIMPNDICFSTLTHAYARSSLPVEAERVLRDSFQKFQISPSRLIYHPVIGGYNLVSLPEEAERLLNEMISLQLANEDTFAMVVDAYANARRLSDAERVYNLSLSLGIEPSAVTSNSLLKALSNCQMPDRAEKLLNRMIQLRQCDIISYNTVMSAYLNSFQPLQSERIFQMLSSSDCNPNSIIQPNATTYQILLAGYLQRKDPTKFYGKFYEMLDSGHILQLHSTHYFLHLFCQISPQDAEKFLQTLEKVTPASIDLIAYQLVIQSFVRNKKPTHAYRLLNHYFESRLSHHHHHPDNHFILLSTFNSIIHGYCQVHKPTVAEKLLDEMQSRGIMPDTYTYTTLISAYYQQLFKLQKSSSTPSSSTQSTSPILKNSSTRIQNLLKEIDQRQLAYNEALYSILIKKYVNESKIKEMNDLLSKMKCDGIEWDQVIYSQVMLGYAQIGDIETVEKLYKRMIEETGIEPNSFIFQSLIIASKRAGDKKRAKSWYHRAVQILLPPEMNERERKSQENMIREEKLSKMKRNIKNDIRYLKSVLERDERGMVQSSSEGIGEVSGDESRQKWEEKKKSNQRRRIEITNQG